MRKIAPPRPTFSGTLTPEINGEGRSKRNFRMVLFLPKFLCSNLEYSNFPTRKVKLRQGTVFTLPTPFSNRFGRKTQINLQPQYLRRITPPRRLFTFPIVNFSRGPADAFSRSAGPRNSSLPRLSSSCDFSESPSIQSIGLRAFPSLPRAPWRSRGPIDPLSPGIGVPQRVMSHQNPPRETESRLGVGIKRGIARWEGIFVTLLGGGGRETGIPIVNRDIQMFHTHSDMA